MGLWDYCAVCGKRIETGQPCIGVKEESEHLCGDSICINCAKIENLPEGKEPMSITDLLSCAEEAEAENAVLRRMQPAKIDGDTLELAAEVSELKHALAMMWFAYVNSDKENPHNYETQALEEAERLLGPWSECMPNYLRCGQKEE